MGRKPATVKNPTGGLAYAENFIRQWKGSSLVKPSAAPHATYSNSPEMLKKAYELSCKHDTLFTLHAARWTLRWNSSGVRRT